VFYAGRRTDGEQPDGAGEPVPGMGISYRGMWGKGCGTDSPVCGSGLGSDEKRFLKEIFSFGKGLVNFLKFF
jgi:hypothetical protein